MLCHTEYVDDIIDELQKLNLSHVYFYIVNNVIKSFKSESANRYC